MYNMEKEMDDLTAAIAEAVEEKGEAFLTDAEPEPVAASGEEEPSRGEVPAPVEEAPEAEEVQEELPTEYWGTSLEGLPEEKVRELLEHFEQQDSTIRKLQAQLAEKPEELAPLEPDEPPADLTDEELLQAAGFDPEDFEVQQMARFLLPGLRRELALEDQLGAIVRERQVESTQTAWNREMDALEESYGKLPGTRQEQLAHAVQNGIASPFELYFRLSAPIRKEVSDVVANARREAARREAAGNLKPGTSNAGEPPVKPGMGLRDAVKAAAESAEKETGIRFSSFFGKK